MEGSQKNQIISYNNFASMKSAAVSHPRLGELPFDSGRKLMTTVHSMDGKYIAIVKGAFTDHTGV